MTELTRPDSATHPAETALLAAPQDVARLAQILGLEFESLKIRDLTAFELGSGLAQLLANLVQANVDGIRHALANRDVLYIGRGTKSVTMGADAADTPPHFYMNSVPAGADIPTRLITRAQSKVIELGDAAKSNKRSLAMYIHPEVAPSCLLLMGITDPDRGSIWNTMPPHLHERRMEAYCYFDLAAEDRVMHFMGRPDNTRHLVVADNDIIMSPAWSIHMGAGTGPYAFVWGMTGENQAYNDVSPVAISELR